MEVVVRSKLFFKRIRLDVPERKAELDTNNFHTFLCRLPKRPFRSDHSFVKYVFTVKVAKRSSFDDVLIVFDSLDLEPKR